MRRRLNILHDNNRGGWPKNHLSNNSNSIMVSLLYKDVHIVYVCALHGIF